MSRYFVLPALFVSMGLGGCGKKKQAKQAEPKPRTIVVRQASTRPTGARPASQAARPSQEAGQGVAEGLGSRVELVVLGKGLDKKNYDLSVTGPARLAKGAKGTYEVVLVPKTPYKVNKLYPHQLVFQKVPSGLVLSRKVIPKKDAAVFQPHKLVFRFQVTAQQAGPALIEGLLKFSVCTPKFCETPKARILLPLNGASAKTGQPGGKAAGAGTPPSI